MPSADISKLYNIIKEMKSKPVISVIIVNHNGCHLLKECLNSLRKQTFRDFEVILVDNASNDGSVEFVKKNYPEVKIILSGKNLGYGDRNNLGIRASNNRYIALFNNDTKADPRWLQKLVEDAEEDEKVGMCASKILNYYNPEIINNTGLLMYRDGIARGRGRLDRGNSQYASVEEYSSPVAVPGSTKGRCLTR